MDRRLVEQHIIGILEGVTKLTQRLGLIDIAAELRACSKRVQALDWNGTEILPTGPRHVGPYLECEECDFDEFAIRFGLDRNYRFECCNCGVVAQRRRVHLRSEPLPPIGLDGKPIEEE